MGAWGIDFGLVGCETGVGQVILTDQHIYTYIYAQQTQAAARVGSPEVGPIAAALLRKGDSAPGSYASRLLLGTSAGSSSGSKGAGGGLSSADSSPALTATTPGSVGRSPEHRCVYGPTYYG